MSAKNSKGSGSLVDPKRPFEGARIPGFTANIWGAGFNLDREQDLAHMLTTFHQPVCFRGFTEREGRVHDRANGFGFQQGPDFAPQ